MDLSSQFPPPPKPSQTGGEDSSMSTLALHQRTLPSRSNQMMEGEQRPRSGMERVELPPIRQAIPEIQLGVQHIAPNYRPDTTSYSTMTGQGPVGSDERQQSPSLNKRRRLSFGADYQWDREQSTPRIYKSDGGSGGQEMPATPGESWSEASRDNAYAPSRGLPAVRSASRPDLENANRSDWRPTLPILPHLSVDDGASHISRAPTGAADYPLDAYRSRSRTYPQPTTTFDPATSYHQPTASYGFQPPQGESYPSGSGHPLLHEPMPFSKGGMYAGNSSPYIMNDPGPDTKQRRRRGNLPKETTDLLKAWFMGHLQHPYPTEDEKQDLMRQTGLQINQISNWFINARRRRLPAMINSARAESDARTARAGEGGTADQSSERATWGNASIEGSDAEGSIYDDEYDAT
ncbi:uncharacterized protein BP5553_07502 [Venustampulla echinocandica]|uniref:Homeobox domain-containing protein n=1 Tax=Venustampulla echinocandica TaxID=2656787 RepID=A0A370TGQ3_9HELO|nr:uncharacterized protein BP5553_07502 [Venustampulla echinocandica]RDL34374.1 hypothetical protein BP5553_07502 [Venustampulla echinocandica]